MTGISVVQSVAVVDASSGAFGASAGAGNTVIIAAALANSSNVTMAVTGATLGGSAGNFAQADTIQSAYAGGFTEFCAIWADPSCAGGQTAVAIAGANLPLTTGSDNGFVALEVSGLLVSASLAAVLDQTATSPVSTTGTAVNSGTTAATTQAAELAVAALAGDDVLSAFTAGWTIIPINNGSGEFNAVGYKILSAAGAQSLAAAQASSGPWAGAIATFRGYAPPPGPAVLVPPGISSPMAFGRRSWPSQAPPGVYGADSGSGAEAGSVTSATVSGTDTGTGTDAGLAVQAVSGDTGSGAEAGSVTATVPGSDTGSGAEADTVTAAVSSSDTGSGADSGFQAIPVPSGDTGTGADSGSVAPPPVTGAGVTQWLNPVRESVTGLDLTLHMASALGAVIEFANHGSERLLVLAGTPGVTVTAGVGGMVLGQSAAPFPPVALTAGQLYSFGPFHSQVQVPGTSTVQVVLSTTSGVQVLVVQGPDAH